MNTNMPTVIAVFIATFLIFTGFGINIEYVGESGTDIKADASPDAKSDMNQDTSPDAKSDIQPDAPTGGSKMQTVYSPAGMAAIARDSFRIAKERVAARLLSRKKDTTGGSLAEVKPAGASEATMANALTELESGSSGPPELTAQEERNVEEIDNRCRSHCWTSNDCEGDDDFEKGQCKKAKPTNSALCTQLGVALEYPKRNPWLGVALLGSPTCTCAALIEAGNCKTGVVGGPCDKTCGECEAKYNQFCTKNCQKGASTLFPLKSRCWSNARVAEKAFQALPPDDKHKEASLDAVRKRLFQALSPREQKEVLPDRVRALCVAQPGIGLQELVEILGAETDMVRKALVNAFKYLSAEEEEAALTHAVRALLVARPAIGPNMLLKTLQAEHPELAKLLRKGTEKIVEVLSRLKAQGADQETGPMSRVYGPNEWQWVAGKWSPPSSWGWSSGSPGDGEDPKKVGTTQTTRDSTKKGVKKQRALNNAVRAIVVDDPQIVVDDATGRVFDLQKLVKMLKEKQPELGAEDETVREALIDVIIYTYHEHVGQPRIKYTYHELDKILKDEHPHLAKMLEDSNMLGDVLRTVLKKWETDRKALGEEADPEKKDPTDNGSRKQPKLNVPRPTRTADTNPKNTKAVRVGRLQ